MQDTFFIDQIQSLTISDLTELVNHLTLTIIIYESSPDSNKELLNSFYTQRKVLNQIILDRLTGRI